MSCIYNNTKTTRVPEACPEVLDCCLDEPGILLKCLAMMPSHLKIVPIGWSCFSNFHCQDRKRSKSQYNVACEPVASGMDE